MGGKGVKLAYDHFDMVSRGEWGARPPIATEPLDPPIPFVVLHYTNTKKCNTRKECVRTIQELQRQHMDDKNLIDIKYNFLIGGDGSVYEGRGWYAQGVQIPIIHECMATEEPYDTIDIAFIGTFDDAESSEIMKKTYENFIKYARLNLFLRMDLYTVYTEGHDREFLQKLKEEKAKRKALRKEMSA